MKKIDSIIRFKTKGVSMLPLIHDGDVIFVEPIKSARELKLGDIVVFPFYKSLLCHRLIKIDLDKVITKGDNSLRGEIVKPIRKLIGKVTFVERGSKRIHLNSGLMLFASKIIFIYSYFVYLLSEMRFFLLNIWYRFQKYLTSSPA